MNNELVLLQGEHCR